MTDYGYAYEPELDEWEGKKEATWRDGFKAGRLYQKGASFSTHETRFFVVGYDGAGWYYTLSQAVAAMHVLGASQVRDQDGRLRGAKIALW